MITSPSWWWPRKRVTAATPSPAVPADARETDYAVDSEKALRRQFAERVAMVFGIGGLALVVTNATLVARASVPLVEVVTVKESGEPISTGIAQPTLSAPEYMIRWQVAEYVKARRDIPASPNGDYSQAKRNVDLVYRMSRNATPYHELDDMVAMFADPKNNPAVLGHEGVTRTVLGQIAIVFLTPTVLSVSWVEQTTNADGAKQKPVPVLGRSITIAPTRVDPAQPNDVAGVYVLHSELQP